MTTVSPTVQPGGTVTVIGREFAQGAPVEIHLDSPTGPLLTTAPPPTTTMTSKFNWDVPIPANTPFGQHILFAVQNYHNMNASVPRSVIYVGVLPPAAAAPAPRPASLGVGSGPSGVSLVLLGLGVAAAGLIVAGLWSLAAGGRRSDEPQAVKAG
ncbi:MAG TPA: hypothetical protein VHT97_04355 [Acidimicrobiales bacterium]|nr:hypothetical protein [Acidimicrobiales bacterium]